MAIRLIHLGGIVLSLTTILSCSPTKKSATDGSKVRAQLGNEVDSIKNSTNEYVLFVQRPGSGASIMLRYLVVSVERREVAVDQQFIPGYVKWIGPYSLEVLSVPGTLKAGDDLSRSVKVVTIPTPK